MMGYRDNQRGVFSTVMFGQTRSPQARVTSAS